MNLTPSEKRLYFTLWGVLGLGAAIFFSVRGYRHRTAVPGLTVSLAPELSQKFTHVEASKKGIDFIEFQFELHPEFAKTVGRYPKQLSLLYLLKRGNFEVDSGEIVVVLPPQSQSVAVRAVNRKKLDFNEVHVRLSR